jgi:hypothetical protein
LTQPVDGAGAITAKNNAQVNFGDTARIDVPLTVVSGADLIATGALSLGDQSRGNVVTILLIDGIGTTLTAGGTSQWTGLNIHLRIQNGATVNLGNLNVFGDSGLGDNSDVTIESSPSVTTTVTAGNIELQTPVSVDFMDFNIGNGLGQSTLAQTGASTFVIGNGDLFGHTTFQVKEAGSYLGGTGGVTIKKTATVNILGGTFTSGGDITNIGGAFNFSSGSLSYVGNLAIAEGGLLGTKSF